MLGRHALTTICVCGCQQQRSGSLGSLLKVWWCLWLGLMGGGLGLIVLSPRN